MSVSNLQALEKIEQHCNDIEGAISYFGDDVNTFIENKYYQNSVLMSLLQIGELTTHLSDDFKETLSSEVDFRGCKRFRNIVAHNYGAVDYPLVWNTIKNEVPQIKAFCVQKRLENESLHAEISNDIEPLFNDEIIKEQEQPLRNDLIEQQQQDGYAASAPHTPQANNYAAEELKVDDPKQTVPLPKKSQEKGGRHI